MYGFVNHCLSFSSFSFVVSFVLLITDTDCYFDIIKLSSIPDKAKDRVTRTPPKSGGELRCSGRVSSSCSTSGTRRVNLVTNPVPFICSNIPAAPAYGVYISQLIRYSRACGSYQDFFARGLLLTRKLLNLRRLSVPDGNLFTIYYCGSQFANCFFSQNCEFFFSELRSTIIYCKQIAVRD
jgi:hypothetical protein